MGAHYSVVALTQWYREGSASYGATGYQKAAEAFNPEDLKVDLSGRHIIVTGGNSGIGRAAAERLADLKATVHIVCRNKERGEKARDDIISKTGNTSVKLHLADMSDFQSVRKLAQEFLDSEPRVDVLINNAGVMPSSREENSDGIELSLATMLGGSFLFTTLLLPKLISSSPSRVINVASGGMYTVKLRVDDLNLNSLKKYDGTLAYAYNKRAQVYLTEMMAARLASTGVTVNSMHPGWADTPGVRSSMSSFSEQKKHSFRTEAQGADTIVWLAAAKRPQLQTGKFWFDRDVAKTHMHLANTKSSPEELDHLWKEAERMCNIQFPANINQKPSPLSAQANDVKLNSPQPVEETTTPSA